MTTDNLYASLGIDFNRLGCVMLDVDPQVPALLRNVVPDAIWYRDPERGIPGPETEPHITLLFGLLEPAHAWREHVDALLADWAPPTSVGIHDFAVFGGPGSPYDCVVATLGSQPELRAANGLLRRLPHVDTFPDYKPHVTVGYVLPGTGKWVAQDLGDKFVGARIATRDLNYGRADS